MKNKNKRKSEKQDRVHANIVRALFVCAFSIFCVLMFLVSIGKTAPVPSYYSADNYSRSVRWACVDATSIRRGITKYNDIPASKQCFAMVIERDRQTRLTESQIALNEAATEYLNKNHRHRRIRR